MEAEEEKEEEEKEKGNRKTNMDAFIANVQDNQVIEN